MLNTYLQNPTVEGDNAMLPQQVCRVLLKVAADVGRASNKAEFSQVETKYERCDSRYLVDELKVSEPSSYSYLFSYSHSLS